jgi:Flp pilus assembly pilin Flp
MLRKAVLRKIWQDKRGVAMTEYIIILVLVAISAIAVISIFGNNIRGLFANASNAIGEMNETSQERPSDETDIEVK